MEKKTEVIPGINIQWPWSHFILSGQKTIETRSYSIPKHYIGARLAIIETPGLTGKKNGVTRARIIGVVTFGESFRYKNKSAWLKDFYKHKVQEDDLTLSWVSGKEKWGWPILAVHLVDVTNPPKKRGIIFAKNCKVTYADSLVEA